MYFVSCVSHAFRSVHCCPVVTCWERADLLALVDDFNVFCVTFPFDILGQVWYLIKLFADRCLHSYLKSLLVAHTTLLEISCRGSHIELT